MKYEAGTIVYIDNGGDGSSTTALSAGAVAGVTITVIIVLLLIASLIVLVLIIYKRRNTMSANIQKLNQEMTLIKNGEIYNICTLSYIHVLYFHRPSNWRGSRCLAMYSVLINL